MEHFFNWIRNSRRLFKNNNSNDSDNPTQRRISTGHCQTNKDNAEATRRFFNIVESILLWQNSVNSISVVIVFNILFWGIVVLEIRGFAAASSAVLIVLCYSTVENQLQKEKKEISNLSQAKAEQIDKILAKVKSAWKSFKQLRKDQPGLFCTTICTISLGLWLIGRTVNGVLLAYTICMSILIGPALLLQIPSKVLTNKEWDSEIEEFLPAVTEDNLQVLQLAGDSGDHLPTPVSVASDIQNDPFNNDDEDDDDDDDDDDDNDDDDDDDDDLVGFKMPSHEEGSTDGFSSGETDVDGMKFQSGHFEKGSSSEDDVKLDEKSKILLNDSSDDSDSEFEIIDTRDIGNFKDV
ncbi:uncharacterized protein LOC122508257 [Leptopilina heterotoma]|uniref:uncharacterized protein LOC122508257 n=1 Tax=Leptopilina heterotoma TaxID=63436 RepID=UPI001CA81C54|nr:uncharacterized protein LOC122508257 [Leptopilina heterotoma]